MEKRSTYQSLLMIHIGATCTSAEECIVISLVMVIKDAPNMVLKNGIHMSQDLNKEKGLQIVVPFPISLSSFYLSYTHS